MFSLITVLHVTSLISYSVLAVLVILGTLNTILCNVMYSPDAGTGLFSLISFKRCYAEFYVGKIRRIRIGRCSEAWF